MHDGGFLLPFRMDMPQVADAIHATKNSEELVSAFEKLWRWWGK